MLFHIDEIKFEHLVTGALVVYLPFHLLEEGFLGFPAWAEKYWHIPDYTIEKWLVHNVLFVAVLLIGFSFFCSNKEKYLAAGCGIILWGVMNALNHIGCSIAFGEIEPGLFSSLLFLAIGVLAVREVRAMGKLSLGLLGQMFLWSLLFWGVPIASFFIVPGLGVSL